MFNNEAIRLAVAASALDLSPDAKREQEIGAAAADSDICPYCGETISIAALKANKDLCPIPECRQHIRPGMLAY